MSETKLSIGEKLKETGRHSLIYGLGSVAQSAAGFLLLPILTATLSKEDYGVYSMILMASAVASAVFYLGMTSALPRSYFDYELSEDRRAIFTTAFIILGLGALLQILLGYFYGDLISSLLVGNNKYDSVVAWAFFGSALGFINQYFFSFLRILRKSISSVVFSLISLIGGVGFTLILLNESPGSLLAPFQALVVSQTIIAIIFTVLYGKIAFIWRLDRPGLNKLISFGVLIAVASFGQMILDWVDRLIIARYLTLADVGTYSAAVRVSTLLNVILILPFSQIWSPLMIEYRTKSNIKDLFTQVLSYFILLGGAILVGSALFAAELLPMLIRSGVDLTVVVVFVITMFGLLIYGTSNIFVAGLFYERKVYHLTYIYFAVAMVKGAVNLMIIPIFGIVGAAVSMLFASLLIPMAVYMVARRYFSFPIDWKRILRVMGCCASPLLYVLLFSSKYPIPLEFRIFIFVIFAIAFYNICFYIHEKVIIKKVAMSMMRQVVSSMKTITKEI